VRRWLGITCARGGAGVDSPPSNESSGDRPGGAAKAGAVPARNVSAPRSRVRDVDGIGLPMFGLVAHAPLPDRYDTLTSDLDRGSVFARDR